MVQDLFTASSAPSDVTRPLAVRMRPSVIEDVLGQSHALKDGSPLRRLANPQSKGSLTSPSSVVLFGPPGVGKTTLAYIVAQQSGRVFEELSAVTSGVKDVRAVLDRAHDRLVSKGQETVLFIDEVHRFSKSQQDALLPSVENRDVTFIGATTENPSFSIIKPLLSRSVVVKLESLSVEDLRTLIERAISSENGLNNQLKIDDDAIDSIIRLSGGDARKTLTILEAAAGAVTGDVALQHGKKKPVITADIVSNVMDTTTVRYDKDGDDHYDVISAFIKSMRGSDVDAILSEAVIAVATAPKSNASYNAINQALKDVDAGNIVQVPLHLRNAPTALMKSWGNHDGYKYAHDYPGAVASQQYMPDELVGREYYHPNNRGYEHEISQRLSQIRNILHNPENKNDKNNKTNS